MLNVSQQVNSIRKGLGDILHYRDHDMNLDLFISSLIEYNSFKTTEEIINWVKSINTKQIFNVTKIPLVKLEKWYFDSDKGDLLHESGGFFSIKGLEVTTNYGEIPHWTQPIIDQPEIGILGIIAKRFNGILYFLLQAKPEPGNINTYQLSPTVQATKSNYKQLHNGKPTVYIEYFTNLKKRNVIVDQIQSEQGARFYKKRNRNIIIEVPDNEEIKLGPSFCWLTLRQISKMISIDNLINMDTRSIIACINFAPYNPTNFGPVKKNLLLEFLSDFSVIDKEFLILGVELIISNHPNSFCLNDHKKIMYKICQLKFDTELKTKIIPLKDVKDWVQTSSKIFHKNGDHFSVIGVKVETLNREVPIWYQPIIKQSHPGIIGLTVRKINGILHFLIQLKLEAGVMDLFEFSPTIQCAKSHYNNNIKSFLDFANSKKNRILVDVNQSEEGGRFFHESNRNIIIESKGTELQNETNYQIWMNLYQLKEFAKFNNYLNLETRSIISILPSCTYG
jgi:dTDP-4-dehydro-6-deoxy-alpha-D-glucopyranose 2,3-dehydratase